VPALTVNSFLLEKGDTKPSECEDAIAVDVRGLRFAVADGATEGFNSRRWAKRLVSAWIRRPPGEINILSLRDDVSALGTKSSARFGRRQLPWYLEEKARQGAFAAFLGLQIAPDGRWAALALGDCCLIQETSSGASSFPLSTPEEFDNRPILVPSLINNYPQCVEHARELAGISLPGDLLLLMSDAIACWYLGAAEQNPSAKVRLHLALTSNNRKDAASLIVEERAARRLRNDDVAIVRIEVTSV
jgi:hypothetical protein